MGREFIWPFQTPRTGELSTAGAARAAVEAIKKRRKPEDGACFFLHFVDLHCCLAIDAVASMPSEAHGFYDRRRHDDHGAFFADGLGRACSWRGGGGRRG